MQLTTLGTLRFDDCDGNDNVKNELGLIQKKNNNFARALDFLEHFSAVTARLRRENARFYVLWQK